MQSRPFDAEQNADDLDAFIEAQLKTGLLLDVDAIDSMAQRSIDVVVKGFPFQNERSVAHRSADSSR
jgi:hypothetical protein